MTAAHGFCDPRYASVKEAFEKDLAKTTGGAALCVYHRGSVVADLWGGVRNQDGDSWDQDTLAMCFSTTKGVVSFCVHLLANDGLIDYEAPVSTYWPEFAQNGKQNVKVKHILSHSAGLHRLRTIIDHAERMLDWEYMVDALAKAAPAYEPGTRAGYHALTYGWLAGELVRRVSSMPVAGFMAERVAKPLGLEGLYLGCPEDQRHRLAPLESVSIGAAFRSGPLSLVGRGVSESVMWVSSRLNSPVNPRRMMNALAPRGIEDVLYTGDVLDASIPAANGFFDARSLAKVYAVMAGWGQVDGVRLLHPSTIAAFSRVQNIKGPDLVLVVPMRWRLGYHMVGTNRGVLPNAFGHFGFGGSGAWCDPSRDLALAYVCSRGTGTPVGDMRLLRLGAAAIKDCDSNR